MDKTIRNKYTLVVGLEIHAQLLTTSKIYASDSTGFGSAPNTNVSVISLAHPGTLPKLNKRALEFAMRMGLACHSEISRFNIFDRKNYFYPDLPKGYQLTQDRTPICKGGHISIRTRDGEKQFRLNRIHVEEDAGKLLHLDDDSDTLVDFNRAGVPLIEIVTEPVIHASEDAYACLSEIRKIVRYLDICDGNMEEGSLRCDANISVMPRGSDILGKKVEVKNMNSLRNVQRAIEHEFDRQIGLIEQGIEVISETRTFNAADGQTYSMRTKETMNDYRYFPDPDLSPVEVSDEWLESIKRSMSALPDDLYKKFTQTYRIPVYDAEVLTESKDVAMFFDEVCEHTHLYKAASNWVMGPVKSYLNEAGITADAFPVRPKIIAELIAVVESGKVSYTMASQRLFPELLRHPVASVLELAGQLNVIQDSDLETILPVIDQVIREFPLKVEEYKNGKKGIVAMFMGEVMKRTKGKADPKMTSELLTKKLQKI